MSVPELMAEPWAVTREGYDSVVHAVRHGKKSMLAFKAEQAGVTIEAIRASEQQATEPRAAGLVFVDPRSMLDVVDGAAIIPVAGYLTRRQYWSGDRASYEWIGARITEALGAVEVDRIALVVDSAGGQVSGTEELAALIRDATSEKPVTAFVPGQAGSAAYWIASAAGRIVATRTAMLGSIGVIWTYIDWSKYDAEMGIEEIDIVSSQSPDKRVDPASSEGRALVQATVDDLAAVFVSDVALNRGVSEATVVSDFGKGWVLVGASAVEAGLADSIGVYDDALKAEPAVGSDGVETTPELGQGVAMDQVNVSDITADFISKNCPQVAAALRDGYVPQTEHEAALEEVRTTSTATATTQADEAAASASTAERERVLGIQSAAKGLGNSKLVAELVADESVTVEAAKARMFEAVQSKRTGALDALADDEENLDAPDPGTDGDGNDEAAALIKSATDYAAATAGIR